jgi:hypothetical protein
MKYNYSLASGYAVKQGTGLGTDVYASRINAIAGIGSAEVAFFAMAYDVQHGYKSELDDFTSSNVTRFNSIVESVVQKIGIGNITKEIHYARNLFNRGFATLKELENYNQSVADDMRWIKIDVAATAFHMHGDNGIYNVKYVSHDGHFEAIYDFKGNLVALPINMGTYNFTSHIVDADKHSKYDVDPYYEFGNTAGDPALGNPGAIIAAGDNLRRYYELPIRIQIYNVMNIHKGGL